MLLVYMFQMKIEERSFAMSSFKQHRAMNIYSLMLATFSSTAFQSRTHLPPSKDVLLRTRSEHEAWHRFRLSLENEFFFDLECAAVTLCSQLLIDCTHGTAQCQSLWKVAFLLN